MCVRTYLCVHVCLCACVLAYLCVEGCVAGISTRSCVREHGLQKLCVDEMCERRTKNNTRTHAHTNTHTHTHIPTHTCKHTHIHSCTHTRTHTHAHTLKHTPPMPVLQVVWKEAMHVRTLTTQTLTRTHKHMHTHAHICLLSCSPGGPERSHARAPPRACGI